MVGTWLSVGSSFAHSLVVCQSLLSGGHVVAPVKPTACIRSSLLSFHDSKVRTYHLTRLRLSDTERRSGGQHEAV